MDNLKTDIINTEEYSSYYGTKKVEELNSKLEIQLNKCVKVNDEFNLSFEKYTGNIGNTGNIDDEDINILAKSFILSVELYKETSETILYIEDYIIEMESLKNFSYKYIKYCSNLEKLTDERLKEISAINFQQIIKNRNDAQDTIYLIDNMILPQAHHTLNISKDSLESLNELFMTYTIRMIGIDN